MAIQAVGHLYHVADGAFPSAIPHCKFKTAGVGAFSKELGTQVVGDEAVVLLQLGERFARYGRAIPVVHPVARRGMCVIATAGLGLVRVVIESLFQSINGSTAM